MDTLEEQIYYKLQDTTTFGFSEIRLSPAFKDILESDHLLSNTVELFCFGDYQDYINSQASFHVLDAASLNKLKQLTLLSEALKTNSFSYDQLKEKVDIHSNSELERLITESIYHNIIEAKLNSQQELVKINTTKGRDVLLSDDVKFEELKQRYPNVQTDQAIFESLSAFKKRIDRANEYLDEIKEEFGNNNNKAADTTVNSDGDSVGASNDISNISISGGSAVESTSSSGTAAISGGRKRKIENK